MQRPGSPGLFLSLRLQAAHECREGQYAYNEGAADSGDRKEQLIHSEIPCGFAKSAIMLQLHMKHSL